MAFMKGTELSKRFHFEYIEPLMSRHFPDIRYASALIGPGSELLGFDTQMSADHDWGPRVLLFLQEQDIINLSEIFQCLKSNAPGEFYGHPLDLNQTVITSLPRFLKGKLGADIK